MVLERFDKDFLRAASRKVLRLSSEPDVLGNGQVASLVS